MSADPLGGVTLAGCGICKDSLTKTCSEKASNGANSVVTPCGHAFHSRCISPWLKLRHGGQSTCPNCRSRIRRDQCHALFLEEISSADVELALLPAVVESTNRLKAHLMSAVTAEQKAKRQLSKMRDQLMDSRYKFKKLRLSSSGHGKGESALLLAAERRHQAVTTRLKVAERKAGAATLRARRAEMEIEFVQMERDRDRVQADNKVKLANGWMKESQHEAKVSVQRAVLAEGRADYAESRAKCAEQRSLIAEAKVKRAEAVLFEKAFDSTFEIPFSPGSPSSSITSPSQGSASPNLANRRLVMNTSTSSTSTATPQRSGSLSAEHTFPSSEDSSSDDGL